MLTNEMLERKFSFFGETNTTEYEYDNDKILKRSGDLHLEYNTPNGQLVKTTLDNIKEYYTYNKVGEVKSYTAKILKNNKEETIYFYHLERDKLGRIIKKVEKYTDDKYEDYKNKKHHHERHEHEGFVTEYSYDKAGRLIHVEKEHGQDSRYIYDQNSNRIEGFASGEKFDAIYDNQDRLIRYNNTTFSYNAIGNIVSRADQAKCDAKSRKPSYQTMSIQYDVFGNLIKYGNVSYTVDPLNKRLTKSVDGILTNVFAYNPNGQLIAEIDKHNTLKKYFIYGVKNNIPDYFIENNTRFKIISDQLGSVRIIINTVTGEVKEKITYDEFGKVLDDSNPNYTPFGYAGGIYDSDTRLVKFGVRDYDARVGRWMSKDPMLFKSGDVNLYGYTENDPINWIDTSGYVKKDPAADTGGGGSGSGGLFGNSGNANSCPEVFENIQNGNAPDTDWVFRGPKDKGSWWNPNTDEYIRPDLNHGPPYGPHWDYRDPSGNMNRIFPSGDIIPKVKPQ